MYLLNTFLGFAIAQVLAVLNRSNDKKNPKEFDLIFFVKDTWQKMAVSLLLSFLLSVTLYLNVGDFAKLVGQDWDIINSLAYLIIGFAPEKALQWIRRKYHVL